MRYKEESQRRKEAASQNTVILAPSGSVTTAEPRVNMYIPVEFLPLL
jgi:hypothetical protein